MMNGKRTWDFGPWTLDARVRRRRPGVTIPEVLFAILVATVGVFSVIVIFPFASSQARRARINDMLAVAGRDAFHAFDSRGMRRADERWLACNPANNAFGPAGLIVPAQLIIQKGESVCIDPRMMASHITTTPLAGNTVSWPLNAMQQMQPAQTVSSFGAAAPGGQCTQVFPYVVPGTTPYLLSPTPPIFNTFYMRRITLWSGATSSGGQKLAMTLPQANSLFLIDDDIAYQRSEKDRSAPAAQQAILFPGSNPTLNQWMKRDSERKISWIATLVPKFDSSGIASDEYTLSVVMIYARPNDLDNLFEGTAPNQYPKKERRVLGALQTTGATGGEIRLGASVADQLKIKPNEWVMVSGSYVLGNNILTRFQWYRISDCDLEPTQTSINPPLYEINATLVGQDWNTSYVSAAAATYAVAGSEYGVNVDIVEGAFAVYEKTIRLEYGSSM